jgi:glycosyltransferase involved in cell wall biosynthesis
VTQVNILIVSAQFPFPPRFGFAMRVYQLARQLAARHRVTLLSYARPDEREAVAALGEEFPVHAVERAHTSVAAKRAAQLASLASTRPFSCRAVHTERMQRAIDELCSRERFDLVQVESSLLCTFAFPRQTSLVLDEHNIEYEVFRRMCEGERSAARRAFNRIEHARFRRFEQRWWSRMDGCVVTSDRELPLVRTRAREVPLAVVPNGVDLGYFCPAVEEPTCHTVVFNGILTYRPNLDAAYHLVDDVWPLVLRRFPKAKLTLVGRGEPSDLRRLRKPGIEVTGEVPDIRPHLARAAVVGVPVRIGGGTRLKVLEGLAMGKAMVSTSLGCEGVAVTDRKHLLIGEDAEAFASRIIELFENPALGTVLGRAGRELVEREYSWELAGERLEALHRSVLARRGAAGDEAVPRRARAEGAEEMVTPEPAGGRLDSRAQLPCR